MDKDNNQDIPLDEINAEMNKYERRIEEIQIKIENSKDDIDQKMKLYKDILGLNNTNEDYALNYLLSLKYIEQNGGGCEDKFSVQLEKYQICISDEKYDLNFKNYPRKNARKKFLEFFAKIKNFLPLDKKSKSDIIKYIQNLSIEIITVNYHNNKKVTWKNEELYLNCLFNAMISSISSLILQYYEEMKCKSKLKNDKDYIVWTKMLEKAKNEKIEEGENKEERIKKRDETIKNIEYIILNIALLYSTFYDYIANMKDFLLGIEDSFKKKFGELLLDNMEKKKLFEDFIQFLATYRFKTTEYIAYWNEIFEPLTEEQQKKIVSVNSAIKFEINKEGELIMYRYGKEGSLKANNYCLSKLIKTSTEETDIENIIWKATKYMKSTCYNENLFVCQTRKYWKELLIDIFRSKTYMEARNALVDKTQINIFMIDEFITDIIDNIKFFMYDTSFLGETNVEINSIYEYGLYNLQITNHSVALLIFYGFHIIINIHEIGGHLNIKYQYYFTLDESFHSPKIKEESKILYSSYAINREKESGESIEIKLFGEVKCTLTIREALFVLNKNNYKLAYENFKEEFQNCNKKTIDELCVPLKDLLPNLGINQDELNADDNTKYTYPLKRKTNQTDLYSEDRPRHPTNFYFNNPTKIEQFYKSFIVPNEQKE